MIKHVSRRKKDEGRRKKGPVSLVFFLLLPSSTFLP
jgi:hypothetical protein